MNIYLRLLIMLFIYFIDSWWMRPKGDTTIKKTGQVRVGLAHEGFRNSK